MKEVTKYQSFDGVLFDGKIECEEHERFMCSRMATVPIYGFVVNIADEFSPRGSEVMSERIFAIKGVRSISPIVNPYEWHGLKHAIEKEVSSRLFEELTKPRVIISVRG